MFDSSPVAPIVAASGATAESRRKYQRIAPVYDLLDAVYERSWKARLRHAAFAGLTGRVLDAGAGTGCNIPAYPAGAAVTAVDLSPAMLDRARRRAERLGRAVSFREADLTATGLPAASFDAAVATFVFCVVPEDAQGPAWVELARLVRPGGEIRVLDYARSRQPLARAWEDLMAPWLNFAFAARYTAAYDRHAVAAGLEPVEDRFVVGDVVRFLRFRVPGG